MSSTQFYTPENFRKPIENIRKTAKLLNFVSIKFLNLEIVSLINIRGYKISRIQEKKNCQTYKGTLSCHEKLYLSRLKHQEVCQMSGRASRQIYVILSIVSKYNNS